MKTPLWILFLLMEANDGFSIPKLNVRGGRSVLALFQESLHPSTSSLSSSSSFDFEFSDSSPTSITATITTSSSSSSSDNINNLDDDDDDDDDSREELTTLKYYRQDPQDLDAETFLLSLSSNKRKELQGIIEQIHFARRRKDYQTSDELTAIVRRKFGVRIYNNPPVWTTRKGMAPESYLRRRDRQQQQQQRTTEGHHPFQQVGSGRIRSITCPLSVQEINALLSRQTQAHDAGRYEEAEAIVFELKINGVQCNVERKLWRADGKKTWEEEEEEEERQQEDKEDDERNDDQHLYHIFDYTEEEEVDDKKSTTILSMAETNHTNHHRRRHRDHIRIRVVQLVSQRAHALVQDDFQLAQCLLLELQKTYGVSVNDQKRTWSFLQNQPSESNVIELLVNYSEKTHNKNKNNKIFEEAATKVLPDLVPPILFAPARDDDTPVSTTTTSAAAASCSYRCSIHSLPLSDDLSLGRVKHLIEERASKREEGKYLEADAMRSELWMTYYVGLSDKLRQWSVGGVFDDEKEEVL